MDTHGMELRPDLARAARALAGVSAEHVASQAQVEAAQLRDYERGHDTLRPEECTRVTRVLEDLGVLFVAPDDFAGSGVRRRHSRRKVDRMVSWENEGGAPGYDNI